MIFVEAVRYFREEDKDVWLTYIPYERFKEKVSAQVLGDFFITGTAKGGAEDWIKSKGVSDSGYAWQIVATCGALDLIPSINQVRSGTSKDSKEVNKLAIPVPRGRHHGGRTGWKVWRDSGLGDARAWYRGGGWIQSPKVVNAEGMVTRKPHGFMKMMWWDRSVKDHGRV
jgi:hypothetical protein